MGDDRETIERQKTPRNAEPVDVPSTEPSGRKDGRQPSRVNLPGFISEDIGLGDVIKRMTSAVGLSPCGGCVRRAQALNSWLVFSRRGGR
jgi:hypothetical protein